MLIQAPHTSTPSPTYLIHHPIFPRSASLNVSRANRVMNTWSSRRELSRRMVVSASEDRSSSLNSERKRKVVEHICLLKTKENLTDEEEKVMLDYLYTTQYQMRGIVAISLGRILEENLENYTHAVYMRFQIKEDLAKFYENSFYLGVLKKHVMPYCHGLINVDYEAEVEDDILPIFRKGEEFNYGVEFVLLISFVDNAFGGPVQHALASLARLTYGFPSLIVQSTQGVFEVKLITCYAA
uniref:Stress-response A/B barrel domain-containing protein n=1 Tax=Fagus sylvatica TaxID=28930 RepID=A0A2N9EQM9_FAGSY